MPPRSPVLGSWIVGSDSSCNIVINHPTVSGHHCRLTQAERGFILEDLGSTNGTFVDGQRLPARVPVPVNRQQQITLGRAVPFRWPDAPSPPSEKPQSGTRVIRIGRSPDSDVVLDYPMISWEHARITEGNGEYILEDLGSRNGTALNEIQNRITQARVRPGDNVYLGSFKISASRLLLNRRTVVGDAAYQPINFTGNSMVIGRDPNCNQPLNYPMISWHHARLTRADQEIFVEDLGSMNGTFVNGVRVRGKVRVELDQEIGLGSFRFRLKAGGNLQLREYKGNVSIEAAEIVVNAADGRRLLDPVSLTVYPSELVALMGPAGAGKTTLLKALNGYSPPVEGQVLFNGQDLYAFYDRFRLQMGYVPQDDIVHGRLTVREALYFSTKLRTDLSDQEIDQRIDKVLDDLGIPDKKNSLIGSPERPVLSGGQRKRVNIAMELISDTPVLFLDEPTSGLSSYDAEGVVELLKQLSRQGKTIITTIHQPSTNVFKRFDNLIMIARDSGRCGALAYFGPAYPDSIEFFDPEGVREIRARNGQEISPEMLLKGLDRSTTEQWCERFAQSHYRRQFVEDRSGKHAVSAGGSEASGLGKFRLGQWITLVRRTALLKVRDKAQIAILLLQAPLFAALIGLVFRQLVEPADTKDIVNFQTLVGKIPGIHFLMVVAAIWFGCNNAARDIVGEWTVYKRERMVNLKLPSYVFSKFSVLFGLCVFQCFTLLGIVYLACNLNMDFGQTLLVLVTASLVGAALGLAISARSTSTESAIALLPVVLLPIIALGGGIRAPWQMGRVEFVSYVVPSRWAYEANLLNEAAHHQCGYTPELTLNICPTGGTDGSRQGVDAATGIFPQWVTGEGNNRAPSGPEENQPDLRHPLWVCMTVLSGMLAILLTAVLGFLKMRDVH